MCSSHHGSLADVLDPRLGDVPVVDHVVVVEDHRRGHDRQQPALDLRRPRLAVQHRVLLEVGDEIGRWLRPSSSSSAVGVDVQLGQRRRVVGVHLITEQHDEVGPFVDRLAAACAARGRAARRHRSPVRRRPARDRTAARAAPRPGSSRTAHGSTRRHPSVRITLGGNGARGVGPPLHPVESDGVRDARRRVEPADHRRARSGDPTPRTSR